MLTTRRDILRQAGTAAVILASTAPWWLVRRAHAARQKKLVVWNGASLAPQVDKIMEEQCYAYAKQAGIKEGEIDYSIIGTGQLLPKLVATLEAGNPPDITRLDSGCRAALSLAGPPPGRDGPGREDAASPGRSLPGLRQHSYASGQGLWHPPVRQPPATGHPYGYPRSCQSHSSQDVGRVRRGL